MTPMIKVIPHAHVAEHKKLFTLLKEAHEMAYKPYAERWHEYEGAMTHISEDERRHPGSTGEYGKHHYERMRGELYQLGWSCRHAFDMLSRPILGKIHALELAHAAIILVGGAIWRKHVEEGYEVDADAMLNGVFYQESDTQTMLECVAFKQKSHLRSTVPSMHQDVDVDIGSEESKSHVIIYDMQTGKRYSDDGDMEAFIKNINEWLSVLGGIKKS